MDEEEAMETELPLCPEEGGAKGGSDDPITLVGMIFETANGLRKLLGPSLEDRLGVGGQSFELLIRLARSPGQRLRMSDLAAQGGLSPSGLTRAMDRLVEAGLASREDCPGDRRVTYACLTPTGSRRMEDALALHREGVAAVIGGMLDPAEQATLAGLIRRLRDRVHPEAALVSAPERGSGSAEMEPRADPR